MVKKQKWKFSTAPFGTSGKYKRMHVIKNGKLHKTLIVTKGEINKWKGIIRKGWK